MDSMSIAGVGGTTLGMKSRIECITATVIKSAIP